MVLVNLKSTSDKRAKGSDSCLGLVPGLYSGSISDSCKIFGFHKHQA